MDQEVEKIYPEFVSENNGTLGIAYHNFSVVNIRAIQEQHYHTYILNSILSLNKSLG
jgi:hypothetical protein